MAISKELNEVEMKIVLASKSPRRREILSMVLPDFEIRVSDADEGISNIDIMDVPRVLSIRKAQAVEIKENEIIIGCDTVVIHNGEILGKPKDDNEAIDMLKKLSDTTHLVVSGICVKSKDKEYSTSCTTSVKMRALTDSEMNSYVNRFHPTDKAGAYGIQEMAGAFVEKIDGDFYNVVGLPLCMLCQILKNEFNVDIF